MTPKASACYKFPVPTWSPDEYLLFAEYRTRPCRDLVTTIALASPGRIIDLGCGPGNSTIEVAKRWPDAEVTGLDSSEKMIATARSAIPDIDWIAADIGSWAESESGQDFDLVFSNAALQWLPEHKALLPKLMSKVRAGGALAFQMPANFYARPHQLMRELAGSERWSSRFAPGGPREWFTHDLAFYYDALAPLTSRVDLWETEYLHVLPDAEGIVQWYKGTGLRPFLEALSSDADRELFVAGYLEGIRAAFPSRPDGRVLFPFKRLFAIAYL